MLFYDIWPQNDIGVLPTQPYSIFFREPEQTIEHRKKKTYKDKNTTKNDERAKVNEK